MTKWWLIVIAAGAVSIAGALGLQIGHAQTAEAQTNGTRSEIAQKPLWRRLSSSRTSPSDLELGGDIYGLLPHEARHTGYITRAQLLALPQVSFTVTNDANFSRPTAISGVALDELVKALAPHPNV